MSQRVRRCCDFWPFRFRLKPDPPGRRGSDYVCAKCAHKVFFEELRRWQWPACLRFALDWMPRALRR